MNLTALARLAAPLLGGRAGQSSGWGRAALALGAAALAAAGRAAPSRVAALQGLSLGASLRAAAALQVPALFLLAHLAPSFGPGEEPSVVAVFLSAAGFAALFGAFVLANAHRRAWIGSLPDCRRPSSLPAWFLGAADLAGAALGAAVFTRALSSDGEGALGATWEHYMAYSGIIAAGATSLFGG